MSEDVTRTDELEAAGNPPGELQQSADAGKRSAGIARQFGDLPRPRHYGAIDRHGDDIIVRDTNAERIAATTLPDSDVMSLVRNKRYGLHQDESTYLAYYEARHGHPRIAIVKGDSEDVYIQSIQPGDTPAKVKRVSLAEFEAWLNRPSPPLLPPG